MSLRARSIDSNPIGFFRTFATPPGGTQRELTLFRGVPISVESLTTTDPFSESTASISFPQITAFDNPGAGDLDWLVPDADIDIVWQNYGPYDFEWSWEGFIVSYDLSLGGTESTFRIDLKGCLYGLDDYLAKPSFPRRPIPYEILIQQAFNQEVHPCGLKQLLVEFPKNWNTKVPEYSGPKYYKSTLRPAGVTPGQLWTGLTSRNTGSWEPVLSGFVQTLLSTMFDEGAAQWTIRNLGRRRPVLFLRKQPRETDGEILEITLGAPGISVTAAKDFTQRANTIYGQGRDEAGITFSGLSMSPAGDTSSFRPYAASPLVYPRQNNPVMNKNIQPKETMIRFTDGLDELAATRVAEGQLQRFADPGFTGTVTLQTDPLTSDGVPFPRMLIKAGTTIRIKGLAGSSLLAHVTQTAADLNALTQSLTFDSKYRDVLTVDEVQARTRDALSPLRSLQVGKFSNTIQDLLFPWSYKEGSGIIPSGDGLNAKEFFYEKIPNDAQFPYESWTKQYPPKDYPTYYIKIGPTDTTNSTNNWSSSNRNNKDRANPIRMAAGGSISLTQLAAYDRHGNVMPVRFHVSIYDNNGVGPTAMPQFWQAPSTMQWLHPAGVTTAYSTGNSHPFIKDAWEQLKESGEEFENAAYLPSVPPVVGWGNYYEPAGYSPGRFSRGAPRSGMLIDNTEWSWDVTGEFSKVDRNDEPLREFSGSLFIEIYCDEQGDEPVFFLGRLFRTEPGSQ